jgi:hypothetical protein
MDDAALAMKVDFGKIFQRQKTGDQLAFSRGEMLAALQGKFDNQPKFRAIDIASRLNEQASGMAVPDGPAAIVRRFLFPKEPPGARFGSEDVGKALQPHRRQKGHGGIEERVDPRTGVKTEWINGWY